MRQLPQTSSTKMIFGFLLPCLLVVVVTVPGIIAADVTDPLESCTPLDSYKASRAIQSKVFDWASREFGIRAPEELPGECDLLLWKDVHNEHNSMREAEVIGRRSFRCKRCSKAFKTWEYLDRHIASRHMSQKQQVDNHAQDQRTCLGRYCGFIPCGDTPTTISSLPEYHPERMRSAVLCKETFAKCFPPNLSAKFSRAHAAMEGVFCEGKTDGTLISSSSVGTMSQTGLRTSARLSLKTVLSWIVLVVVIIYYVHMFVSRSSLSGSSKNGLGYVPPPIVVQRDSKAPVVRKQVQSSFNLVTPLKEVKTVQSPGIGNIVSDKLEDEGALGTKSSTV